MPGENEGKSVSDLLKQTYDFFVPKKTDKKEEKKDRQQPIELGNALDEDIFKDDEISKPKITEKAKPTVLDNSMSLGEAMNKIVDLIDTKNQTIKRSNGTMDGFGHWGFKYEECAIFRKGTEMARVRVFNPPEGFHVSIKDAFGKESSLTTNLNEIEKYLKGKGVETKEIEKTQGARNSAEKTR
ncbi:MAG: hypothetical protein NTY68_00010 [Candidatus Micrarchaeota archaeon]|nr:hypothetical protein [Candidatus Micrarchaeota archaeon]